jgi:integrase
MKQSSVATLRDLLSAIFTAAVKNKIVTENPVRSTEAIGLGEIQRSYLTKPQIVTFIKRLADVDNDSCKYLLLTALMTGLRSGELRALTWQDVNLDTAVLRVNKSVDNKGRVTPPKTKASNAAFRLNPRLADMLSYYKTSQQATFAALGITSDIMFPNTNGKFMTAGTPNIVLKKVIAGTDIAPDFHVHSLRHSFAHALFREGGNIKEVQQAMRHGRATVTQDIYLDAIEMLNDKLLNAPMKDIDNYALEAFTMPQLPLTA